MVIFSGSRLILSLILWCLFYSLAVSPAQAIVNPLSSPNNRFGIHIIDQNDLPSAAALVNSNGGEWGYVTLVIREDDQDVHKWQSIFDQLRRLKLIPLLRLATVPEGEAWKKPSPESAVNWADFLNSLNWVVKNRYVILFNEPNHAKEWGNDLRPAEYTQVVNAFYQALKSRSADFFVLPAGFDLSAPTAPGTMDVLQYWQFMRSEDPNVFTRFDGWTSHSYPNPGFSGTPVDTGRTSIKGYRWEIQTLSPLGLKAEPPIFLTETGWLHTDGLSPQTGVYNPAKVAAFFTQSFTEIWQDQNLVAVTPFLLNYQDPPFDHFSWTKPGGVEVYPQYLAIQLLPKNTGRPVQVQSAVIDQPFFPLTLISDSTYRLPITLTNTGQSIWDSSTYALDLNSLFIPNGVMTLPLPPLEPSRSQTLFVDVKTPLETTYKVTSKLTLISNDQPFTQIQKVTTEIIAPPSLLAKVQLWYKRVNSGSDFTLLIYDQSGLVKKMFPFSVIDGIGSISEIRDVVPNQTYRFVITKPYYLPRQTLATLSPQRTIITFDRLLPLDLFPDGQLTWRDLISALTHPGLVINLFLFSQ